jgi:peptide-methionine (S)-S-oxide reductase
MFSRISKLSAAFFAVLLVSALAVMVGARAQIERPAMLVPPPAIDEPKTKPGMETAVLAGGCFWGVQGVFQHVKGVERAVSGYAGGTKDDPSYEQVSGGWTGHAESVEISFDPKIISYGQILQIYFSVAHDPTELNRQGPDTGTQYRSNIFTSDEEQARVAKAYIDQLNQGHVFPEKIVTRVDAAQKFYPAEEYHQDFLTLHPDSPYIAHFDMPKLVSLKRLFPDTWRDQPMLVSMARMLSLSSQRLYSNRGMLTVVAFYSLVRATGLTV